MNRTPQFTESPATLELKETDQPTNLSFNVTDAPADTLLQIEWDDFDTGTLDD